MARTQPTPGQPETPAASPTSAATAAAPSQPPPRTPARQPSQARPARQAQPPRPPTRAPATRWVPDDSQFETSLERLGDGGATDTDRRFAALAPLPTPVAAKNCTNMWIPAPRLSNAYSLDEIMRSLASDRQPAVWRTSLVHLRDFSRFPNRGISFVCTSDDALARLGNLKLQICDNPVTIRKYSKYDKLYFVDLNRLPKDVPDQAIYDWFVARDARPVLITPTQVHGQVTSRGRTVYFNSVGCPPGLFEPNRDPLREISFDPAEKPCFVQHRMQKYNRVKPPSLRTPPRRTSDVSDASMRGGDDANLGEGTPAPTTDPVRVSASLDSSSGFAPLDSTRGSATLDSAASVATSTGSRPAVRSIKRLILDPVPANATDWQLVQHSQYGVLNRGGAKYMEPPGITPCELLEDASDPHALVYSIPVTPNCYDLLREEGYDTSLPPNVDLDAAEQDGDDDGMTTAVSGFTADSDLLPHQEAVRTLKAVRTLPLKLEQLSVEELQRTIDEFLDKEVLQYESHEDVLAAIQAQPAYFRRIFQLPADRQNQLFKAHAVYRTISAEPLHENETTDSQDRLRTRYNIDTVDASTFFEAMFPSEERQAAALHSALSDLFLMIFAPGVYVDPVKIQALIPQELAPKRLRHSSFLLWSDVNLLCLTRSDAVKIFLEDVRTPPHVVMALRHLSSTPIPPTVETGPSRLVPPQL